MLEKFFANETKKNLKMNFIAILFSNAFGNFWHLTISYNLMMEICD